MDGQKCDAALRRLADRFRQRLRNVVVLVIEEEFLMAIEQRLDEAFHPGRQLQGKTDLEKTHVLTEPRHELAGGGHVWQIQRDNEAFPGVYGGQCSV